MPRIPVTKIIVFAVGMFIFFAFAWNVAPPRHFPVNSIVEVPQGVGLYALGEELKRVEVVRSPVWFRIAAIVLGGERKMKAGEYYFQSAQSPFVIAWRILHGKFEVETAKITIPEGFTTKKISALFDTRFKAFDHAVFERLSPEGYLFPDTYFIAVTATASSTIKLLEDNFDRKIASVMPEVKASKKSLEEIVIMASLLEAEAKTKEEREIASGILWKRLRLGMPLQVDSEMGTYESPGLPDKPINNPGLVSIEAALNPKDSPYLYFLTDKEGKMHYAKTFDEHKANITKYLSK